MKEKEEEEERAEEKGETESETRIEIRMTAGGRSAMIAGTEEIDIRMDIGSNSKVYKVN